MSLEFSLKLVDEKNIQRQILIAMHKHLKQNFKQQAENFSSFIAVDILAAIEQSNTVRELERGKLREELGLTNPANAMRQIAMGIINSDTLTIQEPKISGNKITASIRLEAVPLDLSQFHDIAQQVTEKGQQLPWFKWLTTLGDAIIVRDFKVQAGFPKSSRTGDKIMVKGGGWRVPPEHAGSEADNFITRAVDEIMPRIEKLAMYYFKQSLGA